MATTELIRNTSVSVGTSNVVLSEEQFNTQRSVIIITNTSTAGQNITVSPVNDAVAGYGVVIAPGGFYQDSMDAGYIPTNKRICAISDAAGGTVAIHERIIMKV